MSSGNRVEVQNPLAVANYVIDLAVSEKHPVTNLKLQKILYYLQAAFLHEERQPLIDTKFSRWQFGPVSQEVYYSFNSHGASEITEPAQTIDFEEFDIETPKINLEEKYVDELKEYTVNLLKIPAWKLVEKTHEQTLWSDYSDDIRAFSAPDYNNKEIQKYFDEGSAEELWKSN